MSKYELIMTIHYMRSAIGNIKSAMSMDESNRELYEEILSKMVEKLLYLKVDLARIGE